MWTRVHPRYGTPAAGTVPVGAISAAAVLALALPGVGQLISAGVNAIGIVVALYYGLTATAAAVRFRGLLRTDRRRALLAVAVPGLRALVPFGLGGALCWSFATSTDHFALDSTSGWFELAVTGAMVGSGLVAAVWARRVRRSAYFATGRGTGAEDVALLETNA